jgi:hypothetical protein
VKIGANVAHVYCFIVQKGGYQAAFSLPKLKKQEIEMLIFLLRILAFHWKKVIRWLIVLPFKTLKTGSGVEGHFCTFENINIKKCWEAF